MTQRPRFLAAAVVLGLGLSTVTVATAAAAPQRRVKPAFEIGFEGPLSGPNAQFGSNEVRGARLAVAQANARGTLPFVLMLVAADDQGDPSHAPAAAAALISDPRIVGVVGPAFSGTTVATGGSYESAGLGVVSPSASNPSLSRNGWSTFHRVIATDVQEPQLTAAWLHRRHVRRLAVVWDGTSYGNTTAVAVTRTARALHVKVVRYTVPSSGRYGTIAGRIAATKPGAVYFAGYDTEAAKLAKALAGKHYRGIKVGGNGILSSLFTARARSAGNGWYATCGCMTAYRTSAQKAFASAYEGAYHVAPNLYSAQAFDAANAIIRALSAAIAGGNSSRVAVNTALGGLNYGGITTWVRFTSHGDVPTSVVAVNLFRDRRGHFAQYGSIRTAH